MKCYYFIGVLVVLLALFYYSGDDKYQGMSPIIKLVHHIEHFLFFISGAYHGTDRFNRFYWDVFQIKIPSGSKGIWGSDGVYSVDIEIPSIWKRDSPDYKISARLYIPEYILVDNKEHNEQLPVLVYYHGGGFVLIDNDDMLFDIMARNFVIDGNMIVLSVNYRLAPENKFPSALMDSYGAIHWVFNNYNHEYSKLFDKNKIAVGGDSAGSMLSMSVSLLARDRNEINGKIAAQVLLYPGTYYNKPTESFLKYGEDAYMLPQGKLTAKWFHDQYFDHKTNHYDLSDNDDFDREIDFIEEIIEESDDIYPIVTQPYLNPWAADSLENLPFTHMIAAEYDPLHDEDVLLVQKLKESGVQTKLTDVEKTTHGFFVIPILSETIETRKIIIETLNEVFESQKIN